MVKDVGPLDVSLHTSDGPSGSQMDDFEREVVISAIDYINHVRHGLYSDIAKHRKTLGSAVDRYLIHNDGESPT